MSNLLSGTSIAKFILAGNARFTILNPNTGNRFTYKIRSKGDICFVSLLSGPDNLNDYSYIGYIRRGQFIYGGLKARVSRIAPSVKAFTWFWNHIDEPTPIQVYHEGRCGRCGRVLTVPESIESGFGPECEGRV